MQVSNTFRVSYSVPPKQIFGDLKTYMYLAIEMSQNNTLTWQIIEVSNSTKRLADHSGNHADL